LFNDAKKWKFRLMQISFLLGCAQASVIGWLGMASIRLSNRRLGRMVQLYAFLMNTTKASQQQSTAKKGEKRSAMGLSIDSRGSGGGTNERGWTLERQFYRLMMFAVVGRTLKLLSAIVTD
jgi:hypothetical protein